MKKLLVIGTAAGAVALGFLSGCGTTSSAFSPITTTTASSQTSTPAPQTSSQTSKPAPQASYTQYAHVGLWWADWGGSTAYVHFKAVLESSGTTIVEATGSDSVLEKDVQLLPETPDRAVLVKQLRSKMAALGWTEVGKSGPDWYEIRWAK